MVTTLMNNSTRERFVPRASTSTSTPVVSSFSPVHASSHASFAVPAAATAIVTARAMTRWLGGNDGLGCGSNTNYGTKRIHPGRLGGVT